MKILFFSPFSNIIEHSIPETLLLKEILKNGKNNVVRVYCDSLFDSFCTSMECLKLSIQNDTSDKKSVCIQCRKVSKSLSQLNGLNAIPISKFLSNNKILEINNYIEKLQIENFTFESDHFLSEDLKKKSLYETILKFKLKDLNLNKEQFDYYKTKLKVSLYSYYSAVNIAKETLFDSMVVYSPQYEINNFFCEGINSVKKIKTYFIEGSENVYLKHSGLRIWDWDKYKLVSPVKSKWDDLKNLRLPSFSKTIVKKHINELHKASSVHVYSSKKTKNFKFLNNFSTQKFKKTFLLSMSSTDESFAAYVINAFPKSKYISNVFKNQTEWVLKTIDYFKSKKDYGLIIRIHPREFKNKRETQISPSYLKLLKILGQINYDNIYINNPTDEISIYNLFEIVDVTLVSWSLTAIESLLQNVPVIVYDNKLTNYPDELVISGSTKKEYINNLNEFTTKKSYKNHNNYSFKWLQVNHFGNNVYLKNRKLFKYYILLNKVFLKLKLYLLLRYSIRITLFNLTFNKYSQKRIKKLFENRLNSLLETL